MSGTSFPAHCRTPHKHPSSLYPSSHVRMRSTAPRLVNVHKCRGHAQEPQCRAVSPAVPSEARDVTRDPQQPP